MIQVHSEGFGNGDGLLVLLHGVGATGAVWSPFLDLADGNWPGRILTLDLPGHGASAHISSYDLENVTPLLGEAIAAEFVQGEQLAVFGHSMGGTFALMLASGRFGIKPDIVFAAGVKTVWSDDEIAKFHAVSERAPKLFDSEAEAAEFYLKVSGLYGLVEAGSMCTLRGVRLTKGGKWRLAGDPAVNKIERPPIKEMVASATCSLYLARGQDDVMVSLDDLKMFVADADSIAGGGHNIMVEAPEAVWQWLKMRSAY